MSSSCIQRLFEWQYDSITDPMCIFYLSFFSSSLLSISQPNMQENDCVVDELSLEETKAYSKKMGRWRKGALNVVKCDLFWAVLSMMSATRAPLIHFSNFLKQTKKPSTDQNGIGFGKISLIVNGKCEQIMSELWMLLFCDWSSNRNWNNLTMVEVQWMTQLTFKVILKNASQFFRRNVHPTLQYPLRLFRLIKCSGNVPCEVRKEVAREIVHSDNLDLVTKKIMADQLFRTQILNASRTGELESELHTMLTILSTYIKVDVRENERINKLLSMLGEACPNANLVSGCH